MKLALAIAALMLGTTGALAQIGPERGDRDSRRIDRVQQREFDRDELERRGRRDRDGDRWDRRGPRGPVIRFGAPGYFVRTLPPRTRFVVYDGRRCRVIITRRVTYRGNIVETERRQCLGRPDRIVIRR